MSLNLRGIIPACVTTWDADGRFDEAAYRRYLQWLLPAGAGRAGDQRRHRRGPAPLARRSGRASSGSRSRRRATSR